MKKRIAVLGNAWSIEYLKIVIRGIREGIKRYQADAFMFINYSVCEDTVENCAGEANILSLSEMADFDGYILLTNTLHLPEEFEYLKSRFVNSDKPVISLEYDIPGIPFFGSDNYSGMRAMCDHVIGKHGAKKVLYVSGPVDNEENAVRRKALEDALQSQGLTLKDENVLVANWNYAEVEVLLPEWLKKQSQLPDAVICANDMMAMGACTVLERLGYKVPEDVIVTGFDNISTAEAFSPSIATVGRDWEDLGNKAVQYLFDRMEGKELPRMNHVNTYAMPNESCGCERADIEMKTILSEKRNSYNNYLSRANIGLYVCELTDSISKAVSEQQLYECLHKTSWNVSYEGSEFYICLDMNFFTSLQGKSKLKVSGYAEEMDVIYGRKDGIAKERMRMDTANLVPDYDQEGEDARLYIFSPLYGEEGSFGYAVFGDEMNMLYDYTLYSWVRHMNMSLRNVRRGILMSEMNHRLENLMNTDALTGVYNRMGCENIAYPFLEGCNRQGKCAALMFADINKMKLINDNYGHLQGDFAIRTVADAIKHVLKESWIVVRYGGDEFLMVGECENENYAEEKLQEIALYLQEQVKKIQLPYKLKVSLGHVLVKPDEVLNMSECLTRAENAMYVMKKKLHAEEGYSDDRR